MLIDLNTDLSPIRFTAPPITSESLERFNHAIGAQHILGAAPTFATTFRKAEFVFLNRLRVDLKKLLHIEQGYEYVSDFCEGDIPEIETRLISTKERRGMAFVSIITEVRVKNTIRVLSHSSFVLRDNSKE